ncbi:hypothetical protein RJ639_002244 [Escallonia herrerae]|uniref:Uncharacterized protein n=1 Tax=Escallonia herrerae TaxID=1293975 RepID=A0AA88X982_9ASTE|nr:hypothetical protein RJ639_002244 [Escallonia herrerae]
MNNLSTWDIRRVLLCTTVSAVGTVLTSLTLSRSLPYFPLLSKPWVGFEAESEGGTAKSYGEDAPAAAEDKVKVTRSIMIVKPPGLQTHNGSPPASPAGSTPPVSPYAGSPSFRFRRRSTSDAFEKASGIGTRSPRPPYEL